MDVGEKRGTRGTKLDKLGTRGTKGTIGHQGTRSTIGMFDFIMNAELVVPDVLPAWLAVRVSVLPVFALHVFNN